MCLEVLEVLEILGITQTLLQLAYEGNSAQPLYAYPSMLSFLLFRHNNSRGRIVKALKMQTKMFISPAWLDEAIFQILITASKPVWWSGSSAGLCCAMLCWPILRLLVPLCFMAFCFSTCQGTLSSLFALCWEITIDV